MVTSLHTNEPLLTRIVCHLVVAIIKGVCLPSNIILPQGKPRTGSQTARPGRDPRVEWLSALGSPSI